MDDYQLDAISGKLTLTVGTQKVAFILASSVKEFVDDVLSSARVAFGSDLGAPYTEYPRAPRHGP